MIERTLLAAMATTAIATLIAWRWDARAAISVVAGAAWNLASLWCLAQMLAAWLGSSQSADRDSRGGRSLRRRAIGWLLVKFPLLYVLIVFLFRSPAISLVAFSIGFSVVLMTAVIGLALPSRRLVHGR